MKLFSVFVMLLLNSCVLACVQNKQQVNGETQTVVECVDQSTETAVDTSVAVSSAVEQEIKNSN